ncbi:LacI family DNA-binding transcriptional regulator [Corynebacterium tapiri]|uniref:LacI family transcriptional regulator n=1 Tax=Corynebacterium tapiri TaxID=1448266 RepID=A0A5C4U1L0_9CORY|nr:LacI family DNA-binding transcriptional regulator [Corynebacterium tapiri]TNL95653.1 LacI family transcriptional regulator [Corynebacterium tapiri]
MSGATIYQVAERAGVSASTVSRVFARPERVSFATAERVRAAAAEVGYRQDVTTRSGTGHNTGAIGLVVADGSNPFFQDIRAGADHAAKVVGSVVLTADIRESLPEAMRAVERLVPLVDALLLASSRLDNADVIKVARRIPTVVINRPVPGVPSVIVDSYTGTLRIVAHLVEQGARTVTYISGPRNSWADSIRWRALIDVSQGPKEDPPTDLGRFAKDAYVQAQQLAGLIDVRQMQADQPNIRGGRRAFEAWRDQPTDAVVCFNDLVAIGFIDQAAREGVRVPEHVLVAGYDATDLTGLVKPSLTSVAAPLRAVGRVAAANALAMARSAGPAMSAPRVLPTRLVVRESTVRRV